MITKRIVSLVGSGRSVEGLSQTEVRLITAYEAVCQGNGILAPYEPRLLELLPRDPETIVMVLDIAEAARNLEYDKFRYVWTRLRGLGPLTVARLLPTGVRLGVQLLRLGVAGRALLLVAAELRHISDHGFKLATLHWQIADFLVATGNSGWLSRYVAVARCFGLRAGLCSNDLTRALELTERLSGLDFVIAPLSAVGFRMTPNQEVCEAAIRRRRADVFPHLGSLSTLDLKDRDYVEGLGLTRFVVDA